MTRGMRVEHVAEGASRPHRLLAGGERLGAGGVQLEVPLARLADDDGAHQRDVVEPVDAGEFERDLVVLGELSPAALDAAEERVLARADDEGIAGIVAAAGKDRALHRGEDFAFVGAGADQLQRRVERIVGERGGAAHIGELGRAFQHAQRRDEIGGVLDRRESLQRLVERAAVRGGQAVRVVFDADARAEQAEIVQEIAKLHGRAGAGASVQTTMFSISDVWRAWRRSAERVSSVKLPSRVKTRHWKKQ